MLEQLNESASTFLINHITKICRHLKQNAYKIYNHYMSLENSIDQQSRDVVCQKQPIYKTLASLLTPINKDKFDVPKPLM